MTFNVLASLTGDHSCGCGDGRDDTTGDHAAVGARCLLDVIVPASQIRRYSQQQQQVVVHRSRKFKGNTNASKNRMGMSSMVTLMKQRSAATGLRNKVT